MTNCRFASGRMPRCKQRKQTETVTDTEGGVAEVWGGKGGAISFEQPGAAKGAQIHTYAAVERTLRPHIAQ